MASLMPLVVRDDDALRPDAEPEEAFFSAEHGHLVPAALGRGQPAVRAPLRDSRARDEEVLALQDVLLQRGVRARGLAGE